MGTCWRQELYPNLLRPIVKTLQNATVASSLVQDRTQRPPWPNACGLLKHLTAVSVPLTPTKRSSNVRTLPNLATTVRDKRQVGIVLACKETLRES